MEIVVNKPIKVSRGTYNFVRKKWAGVAATRTEGFWPFRRYYVKLMLETYSFAWETLLRGLGYKF